MNTFNNSMFKVIQNSLTDNQSSGPSKFKEFLKLSPGNTTVVRLVPNTKSPEKTFFHYYSHSWESFSTGRFMSVISPQTFGERDPISEVYLSIQKHGSEEEKKKHRVLARRENWLVNVYVVNDPVNPENNGEVKILRYGKQLHKVIMDALQGDEAEEVGERMFDLSEKGCNLRIKCERQGDFPTYVSSKFALPGTLEGVEDSSEVYESVHSLDDIYTVKSYDDLKQTLDEHFYCKDVTESGDDWDSAATAVAEEKAKPAAEAEKPAPKASESDDDPLNDDKVKELLKGLDG